MVHNTLSLQATCFVHLDDENIVKKNVNSKIYNHNHIPRFTSTEPEEMDFP